MILFVILKCSTKDVKKTLRSKCLTQTPKTSNTIQNLNMKIRVGCLTY